MMPFSSTCYFCLSNNFNHTNIKKYIFKCPLLKVFVIYLFSTCFSHHREIAIRETVLMDVVLQEICFVWAVSRISLDIMHKKDNSWNGKQSLMYVSSRLNRPQQKHFKLKCTNFYSFFLYRKRTQCIFIFFFLKLEHIFLKHQKYEFTF